jgi:rare lipoprotein A
VKRLLVAALLTVGIVLPPTSAVGGDRDHFAGQATWYRGAHGACTPHFTDLYAANRTLPCWSRVRVQHGRRSVVVTIEDRGPFGAAVIDLAPRAFRQLAPLGAGRIWIRATVLRRGRHG